MLLFAINTNFSYRIFTCANEKFLNVFVRVFTKSDAMGATLSQIHLQTRKLSCNSEPDFMLFALALQIVLVMIAS